MKKGYVENGFIIDLSGARDTSQLVLELSSIMEHPDVKGKNVCLKLGKIDLKQSQLLSIKALVESMDAVIATIDTKSEQTSVSAESLGLKHTAEEDEKEEHITETDNAVVENVNTNNEINNTETTANEETEQEISNPEPVADNNNEDKVVEIHTNTHASIDDIVQTTEDIVDVYTEESTQELSEIIPAENFKTNFQSLALDEGLVTPEEISKYILLDTGDVLPENAEENAIDTKTLPTLYLNQNLRSGQTVSYEGNILLLGDAHPGSEIIADGDITVWGILGGIAHSGAKGNISAKVRALKLNAIQLRIAGLYARRNDTLNVPYVQKTNEFTPEEAQIEEGRIVIYKKLRRD